MATVLTRANLYLGKSLFGVLSSFKCPEIEAVTAEIKHGFGTYNVNVGFSNMTASAAITGVDVDVFNKVSNAFSAQNFTVYGSLDEYTNSSLASSKQAKIEMRATISKLPLMGELKAQEKR